MRLALNSLLKKLVPFVGEHQDFNTINILFYVCMYVYIYIICKFHLLFIYYLCRKKKVFFHTDAAQAIGKVPIDVNAMNIDLMSISGHKLYGPKGNFVINYNLLLRKK